MGFMNIAIIGANGNVGACITHALLNDPDFKVTILSRTNSESSFPAGARVRKVDYDSHAELVEALHGIEAVVCAVGAAGFEGQKRIIDAAIAAGVQRYLPSEFSSNTKSQRVQELVPAFKPKTEVLHYLRTKESTGLTWTGLCTGPLLDWGLKSGFLGFNIAKETATIWDDGKTAFSSTTQVDLGKAITYLLKNDPEATVNRYLYVSSVTTTQNAILAALQKVTRKTWTVNRVETDKQVEVGRRMVSEGDFNGMFILVQASFWGNDSAVESDFSGNEGLANNALGLEDRDLEDIVLQVAQ